MSPSYRPNIFFDKRSDLCFFLEVHFAIISAEINDFAHRYYDYKVKETI